MTNRKRGAQPNNRNRALPQPGIRVMVYLNAAEVAAIDSKLILLARSTTNTERAKFAREVLHAALRQVRDNQERLSGHKHCSQV